MSQEQSLKSTEILEPQTSNSPSDTENTDLLNRFEEENYSDTTKMPFPMLLKMHPKQTVWGFKYGQNVIESALARHKNLQESSEKKNDSGSESNTESEKSEGCKPEPGPSTSKVCTTEKDHKTPHSRKEARSTRSRTSKRKNSTKQDFGSPRKTRRVPLPLVNWADSKEVWMYMVYKEEASLNLRNPRLFEDFSNFMPRTRAILLDWVMEVCEVYHLRRVTYYLTVDYFDRFLSLRPDVPKNQLQLVGVTCLFLASKLEEIYPPRLTEFSYVCDGACSPEDILNCELLILNSLGWDLNVMTPSDWLNLYMQIHFQAPTVVRRKLHQDTTRTFLFPQYSGYQFTRASQMIDAFSLDPGFLKFSYSTLAAAAMYFMYGRQVALDVSGLTWEQLQPCAEYMAAFYLVLRDTPDPRLISCKSDTPQEDQGHPHLTSLRHRVPDLVKDENHSLQTHVVNMEYFEKSAIIRLEQMGLKVERTYVSRTKKTNSEDTQESQEDDTKENRPDEQKPDDDLVCMYDVEKVTCDAVALDDSDISISNISSPDADLILTDDKALLSFDEILDGLIKCNQKNIPMQTQSPSKQLLEEALNRINEDDMILRTHWTLLLFIFTLLMVYYNSTTPMIFITEKLNTVKDLKDGITTARTIIAYSLGKQIELDGEEHICDKIEKPLYSSQVKYGSKFWTKVDGSQFYVASVTLDRRLEPYYYLRIVGVIKGSWDQSMFCQFLTNDEHYVHVTKTTVKPIWYEKWDLNDNNTYYNPVLMSCRISKTRTKNPQFPIAVSLSPTPCAISSQFHRISVPEKTINMNFTLCVKPLNFRKDISQHLVQWIELCRILGAQYFHIFISNVTKNTRNVLEWYRNKFPGTLHIEDFEPVESKCQNCTFFQKTWQRRRYEITSYNKCFNEHLNSKYIIPLDIDELIVPKTENRWFDLIKNYTTDYSSLIVQNVYFFKRMKHRYNRPFFFAENRRIKLPSKQGENGKSFISTGSALTVFNHYALHLLRPDAMKAHFLPFKDVQLNHYKESCNDQFVPECHRFLSSPIVVDDVVSKYQSEFAKRYGRLMKMMESEGIKLL